MGGFIAGLKIGAVVGVVAGVAGGVIALVVKLLMPAKRCPNCGGKLPKVRMPSSLRQWIFGGVTCRQCGCEVYRKGQKVAGPKGG